MFWGSENTGTWRHKDRVHVYELEFNATIPNSKGLLEKQARRCMVICENIEDAIAECRKRWPTDFVLHQVSKRNQRCNVIVSDAAIAAASVDEQETR